MKRKWQIGRVVLAGALRLGVVALWKVWPAATRWCVSPHLGRNGVIIGFDDVRGLIYVTMQQGNSREIRCYDIRDGSLHASVSFELPPIQIDPAFWPLVLAPRGTTAVALSMQSELAYFLNL